MLDELYEFKKVIKFLLDETVEIQWDLPHEIKKLPDDLDKLEDGEVTVEYWVKFPDNLSNKKYANKKITPLVNKHLTGRLIKRSIIIGSNLNLDQFDSCKKT